MNSINQNLTQAHKASIRVVVVDDSKFMREFLCSILNRDPDICVVGTAESSAEAREVIRKLSPDVITLDIQMPEMDGVEFLRRIMKLRPMPVVMVTGHSEAQASLALKTQEIGAVGLIAKPNSPEGRREFSNLLCDTVRGASLARFSHYDINSNDRGLQGRVSRQKTATAESNPLSNCKLLAIGASTGGVTAISRLMASLKAVDQRPPIVIAQHMPREFTGSFAARLAQTFNCDVAEARDQEILKPNMVRIAPGGKHLRICRKPGVLLSEIGEDALINNHRPSVDALFSSVATELGPYAAGVILTGMGGDGAKGLLEMREAGAYTMGEAESSCTVYGMPAVAQKIGAVVAEKDIDALAYHLQCHLGLG